MVLAAGRHAELAEDARDVLLDGVRRDDELLGDALVRAALGHQLEHLALARREGVERIVAAAAAEHVRDDGRVEHRPAGRDALDGIGEQREVGHAVLEQVADALGAVADQVDRVALLGVRAEHEHADVRLRRADLQRRAQPVVGVVGRHLHVDDRDVRLVRADLAQQVGRVGGLGDDLEAGVAEQPHDPLAQQRLVFSDDDSHGGPRSSTRRGDASSALGTNPRAPERSTPSPERGRVERRDEHDGGVDGQLAGERHAVAVGQVDVAARAVGPQRARRLEPRRHVRGDAHDLIAARRQQHPRRRAEGGGVIDDEDGAGHGQKAKGARPLYVGGLP